MSDQQLRDLEAIIQRQEEELRQARSREVALEMRVAKLEKRNARLLGLINRMGDLFKTALRKETADLLREDFKKELPFFESLAALETSDE